MVAVIAIDLIDLVAITPNLPKTKKLRPRMGWDANSFPG